MPSLTSPSRKPSAVADVWVATRLPRHLGALSYLIPAGVDVRVGDEVRVDFRRRSSRAVVVAVRPLRRDDQARLFLRDVVSRRRCPKPQLAFVGQLADLTCVSPGTIISRCLPPEAPRSSRGMNLHPPVSSQARSRRSQRSPKPSSYVQFTSPQARRDVIANSSQAATPEHPLLILTPTLAAVQEVRSSLPAELDARAFSFHHALKRGEARRVYQAVHAREAAVIIATRQGLFLPFSTLTTILIDTEEDASLDQGDQNPRFELGVAADLLAAATGAAVIRTGYAPRIETAWAIARRRTRVVPQPIGPQPPVVEVLDRQHGTSKPGGLDDRLTSELCRTPREQSVIVVSAHAGAAAAIRCQDCQRLLLCSSCSAPLQRQTLTDTDVRCRQCGRSQTLATHCPTCGSVRLRGSVAGAEQWRDRFARSLPDRPWHLVLPSGSSRGLAGQSTNIVGTLKAVLATMPDAVDVSVIPDLDAFSYRPDQDVAAELFPLLWQLRQRTRRTLAIITSDPSSPLATALERGSTKPFYASELSTRRTLALPPFSRQVTVELRGGNRDGVRAELEAFRRQLVSTPWSKKPLAISPVFEGFPARDRGRWAVTLDVRFELDASSADWQTFRAALPLTAIVSTHGPLR